MTTSIVVRKFEVNKHFTDQYAVLFMYFNEKNKHDKNVRVKITKKIHLIDDLKVNILLENDVLRSKLFDICMSFDTVYIESCDVIISIKISNHKVFQSKSVHSTKVKIISTHSKRLIFIHKTDSCDRDYLFESTEINFPIYAYLIDVNINFILI